MNISNKALNITHSLSLSCWWWVHRTVRSTYISGWSLNELNARVSNIKCR